MYYTFHTYCYDIVSDILAFKERNFISKPCNRMSNQSETTSNLRHPTQRNKHLKKRHKISRMDKPSRQQPKIIYPYDPITAQVTNKWKPTLQVYHTKHKKHLFESTTTPRLVKFSLVWTLPCESYQENTTSFEGPK